MKVSVRTRIQTIYSTYHSPAFLTIDPLTVVHRYKGTADCEVVAFIAALLSYGRVELIIRSIESIVDRCESSVLSVIMTTSYTTKKKLFKGFVHRFNTGDDIALLCEALKNVYRYYGTLEDCFHGCDTDASLSHKERIEFFIGAIIAAAEEVDSKNAGASFRYLLPLPSKKSGCKRINMFLRWMIRADDGIDLGIWTRSATSDLIIPVDVHVVRIGQTFGLTARKGADWRCAEEITEELKKLDAQDPVKFDFSLCRFGMLGEKGRKL